MAAVGWVGMQKPIKSKKAPRPGAFLLPKPKPMRRITLLSQYNGPSLFLVALSLEKS
jgi:hypothetical protein